MMLRIKRIIDVLKLENIRNAMFLFMWFISIPFVVLILIKYNISNPYYYLFGYPFLISFLPMPKNYFLKFFNIDDCYLSQFFDEKTTFLKDKSYKEWIYNKELIDNKEFILKKIEEYPFSYYYASENLKKDKEVALAAISEAGYLIDFLPKELKNDSELDAISLAETNSAIYRLLYLIKNNWNV